MIRPPQFRHGSRRESGRDLYSSRRHSLRYCGESPQREVKVKARSKHLVTKRVYVHQHSKSPRRFAWSPSLSSLSVDTDFQALEPTTLFSSLKTDMLSVLFTTSTFPPSSQLLNPTALIPPIGYHRYGRY